MTPPTQHPRQHPTGSPGRGRWAVWAAGLLVAVGAAATTAHGLYEVARAAGTPPMIAWLYPLITDGLALVAYASSTRLIGSARRYAWVVVVLAAGLSGLAQATYLAGGVAVATPGLRFGVGAWPAIAAAIAAHLLFLIGTTDTRPEDLDGWTEPVSNSTPPGLDTGLDSGVQTGVQTPRGGGVQTAGAIEPESSAGKPELVRVGGLRRALAPRDRARTLAELQRVRTGELPTVRELADLAEVSRGTAANALEELREPPQHLHMITTRPDDSTQP